MPKETLQDNNTQGIKYLAFLRSINVGGNRKVKMEDLKKMMEDIGFQDVKTLIASGNICFMSEEKNAVEVRKKIEINLRDRFGFDIPVMLRTSHDIAKLVEGDPFKNIKVTKDTRLYITFLGEKPISTLKIPHHAPGKDFSILKVTEGEVISFLELSPANRTGDSMKIIEKEFGRCLTTRNWNTVLKTANL